MKTKNIKKIPHYKEYTPVFGCFTTAIITLLLLIPVLNIAFLYYIAKEYADCVFECDNIWHFLSFYEWKPCKMKVK